MGTVEGEIMCSESLLRSGEVVVNRTRVTTNELGDIFYGTFDDLFPSVLLSLASLPSILHRLDRVLRDDERWKQKAVSARDDINTSDGDEDTESECRSAPRLMIHEDGGGVRFDARDYPLEERQVAILGLLIEANGNWLSGPEMGRKANVLLREERIDRHVKKLPNCLRNLIDTQTGKGFRLRIPK